LTFNASHSCTFNFGQWRYFDGATTTLDATAGGYFRYTPPTDFIAFQQDNLPANTAGITGFSWIKNRDAADNHILQDRVRGIYNYLESNTSADPDPDTNSVQRFLQQGVQIGNMDAINTSAESFVLWQWANNGAETTNSVGTIDSVIRVNDDAGFSMGTYTGTGANATIGHGQSAAPEFIMVKNGDTTNAWTVQSLFLTSADYVLYLNTSAGEGSDASAWNSAFAGATTISIGTDPGTNGSTNNMAFWAWRSIEGYSAFGSYTGNGDPDGPFIYFGFRPQFILFKCISTSGSWLMFDAVRQPYNPNFRYLLAQGTQVERSTSDEDIDMLGSGVKLRSLNSSSNSDGATYIYAAFAENPFGGSGVAQAKAV